MSFTVVEKRGINPGADVFSFDITGDPTSGAGLKAGMSSVAKQLDSNPVDALWYKTGPAQTDWELFGASSGGGSGEAGVFYVQTYYDALTGGNIGDWGAAFNAAVLACLGASDPVTTVRVATGTIVLPAGNLACRTMPSIKSALGIHVRGAGRYQTALCPDGFESGLELVGVCYSSFEEFSIRGSGTVDNGVYSYHDATKAIKYPTSNTFRNVDVMELTFTAGFRIGGPVNGDQTDKHSFYDCRVQGGWSWGDDFTSSGFIFGFQGGGAGNNLVHNIFGLNVAQVAFGVNVGGSCVNIFGGSGEQMHSMIYDAGGPIEASSYNGLRAEGCRYLYTSNPGYTWDRKAALRDCTYHRGRMEGPTFMQLGAGGTYVLENISVEGGDPGNYTPMISTAGAARTAIFVHGLSLCDGDVSSLESWLGYGAGTSVQATGVSQTDSTGAILVMQSYQAKSPDAPVITGDRGSNVALGSLLGALKLRGDIFDTSYSDTPISDDFVRTNSSSALGTGWTLENGVGGISSDQGYTVSSTGRFIATRGTMVNGILRARMSSSDWEVVAGAVVFRFTDTSNFLFVGSVSGSGPVGLYQCVSGVESLVSSVPVTGFGNSEYQDFHIIVTGDKVDVFMADVPVVRWTLTAPQLAMSGTKCGFTFTDASRPTTSLINLYEVTPQ